MFCSTAPFSLLERTCSTYLWMDLNLQWHNRATIEPGVVGTAINGTIRLLSDFEVRYSILINSYIYISFWYLWQLARDPRTACTWQSFARESSFFSCIQILMIILTDGFPVSHSTMNNAFAAAFFKMGLLGQAHNPNVSNRWCFVKVYLATNHLSHSWLTAVSSSLHPPSSTIPFSSLPANSSPTSTNR